MTTEPTTASGRGAAAKAGVGDLALALYYVLALAAGPVLALGLWFEAFGLWGTDNPAQPGAIPSLLCLAAPVPVGIALGLRARAGSRGVLVAPAIPFALAALVPIMLGELGPILIYAAYAFGPVAVGRLIRRVRASRGAARGAIG